MFTDCDVDKILAPSCLARRRNVASNGINLPFLELIVKIEFAVVNFMYVYNKNIITLVT